MVTWKKNRPPTLSEYAMDKKENETEYCVLCGDKTPYVKSDNINIRKYFVEGVGQLCPMCDCKLDIHITKIKNVK